MAGRLPRGRLVALAGLGIIGIATALLISGDPTPASPKAAQEVSVVAELRPVSPGTLLLRDLSPISSADAMTPDPAAAEPGALADLVTEPDLPSAHRIGLEDLDAEQIAALRPARQLDVRHGDSLSRLFERHGLPTADWIALSKLKGEAKRLGRLQPGDILAAHLQDDGAVAAISLPLDPLRTLTIARNPDGGWHQSVAEAQVEYREVVARGSIENSLFLSARAAGLSDRLIMEFADMLAWDVDFAMDIRQGDKFTVIYREVYRDGEKLKDGDIVAAEFHNQGRAIRAVQYTDEDGRRAYYSPEGLPMKKAFLRSPVEFTRISSRFSLGRKHPILNRIRAHRGVDYAAPRGTPIKAAGAGKVIFAGRKGGYGNVLILQHASKYTTLYAHIDRFGSGIRRGASVNQGQTIATVGSTGLATGPHLHYEFRVNDQHVDPLTVKLPEAPKIAASKLPRFRSATEPLVAKLDALQPSNEIVTAHAQP